MKYRCGYFSLESVPQQSRHNCCMAGKAVDDPAFPKLDPLPDELAKEYLERTAHMSKFSSLFKKA